MRRLADGMTGNMKEPRRFPDGALSLVRDSEWTDQALTIRRRARTRPPPRAIMTGARISNELLESEPVLGSGGVVVTVEERGVLRGQLTLTS